MGQRQNHASPHEDTEAVSLWVPPVHLETRRAEIIVSRLYYSSNVNISELIRINLN